MQDIRIMMRIGFVGAGKVGFSLGRYFHLKGVPVVGYCSLYERDAREAAALTGSRVFSAPGDLAAACDCLFLTVPDNDIAAVWSQFDHTDITGKLFCHCSGSLASAVLAHAVERGGGACSLHPLMAIPDRLHSHTLLERAVFFLEGTEPHRERLRALIAGLGNDVQVLPSDKKALYHCAAVFVSNFVVALAHTGEQLFQSCGLTGATPALFQLLQANAESVRAYGPAAALTGPVERGDTATIQQHLASLGGDDRELYALLARKLADLASAKHPDRDYGPTLDILGDRQP